MHNVLGGTIDPHAAWLVLRGLKTLNLRVKQQNATAMLLATRLEAHPKIAAVHYPGQTSHWLVVSAGQRAARNHALLTPCWMLTHWSALCSIL